MNYNNNACRLCTQESNRLRPLFSGNEDIISKLRILAPEVKITAVDGLSNNVCERCVTQLNSSCEFKMLLEATYMSLKERCQIQDAAFNEVLFIKDEPMSDESESEIAAVEVNETREAANAFSSELNPLSVKSEAGSSSCTEALSQSGSLSKHDIEEIHCKHCKRKFTTEAGLKTHSSCHVICQDSRGNVKHSFCCSYCDKTFNTEYDLKIHRVKYHVVGQKYECSVCNKTFISEVTLNRHVQTHIQERQHECSICKEKFETEIELRLHSRNHVITDDALSDSVFPCPACKKQFATSKAMLLHRRFCSKSTIVGPSTKRVSFECSYCKKLFSKEKAVRTHEIHCRKWQNSSSETLENSGKSLGVFQYGCSLCSERFSSLSDLIRHRGVHFKPSAPAPHSSKEKYLNAATSDDLVPAHEERKFDCTVCKQEFNTCKGLAVHTWRNHREIEDSNIKVTNSTTTSDKSTHQCSVCKLAFESGRALSMHRWHRHRPELQQHISQRHNSDGIYMCRLCDRRFKTNKERIIHNLTYHGFKKKLIKGYPHIRNSFTCHVCMQTFISRTVLLKHKWHKHRAKQQGIYRSNQNMSEDTGSSHLSNENYFACSICNERFTSKRLVSKHKWYEHKYKADKLAGFLNKNGLNDLKHTCFVCKRIFNSLRALAKHNMHRHRNGELMNISDVSKEIMSEDHSYHLAYVCHHCGRSFKSPRALTLHNSKTHRKKNPGKMNSSLNNSSNQAVQMYKCSLCALKFSSCRDLAAHMLLHKRTKTAQQSHKSDSVTESSDKQCSSYSCSKCPSTFDDLLSFESHQKVCDSFDNAAKTQNVHSGNICSRRLSSSSALTAHRNSHDTSETATVFDGNIANTYTCTTCMQTFESEECLVTHSKIHEENQQKNCLGGETDSDNFNKPAVEENSGASNEEQCHICSSIFKNTQDLEAHITAVHSQSTTEKGISLTQENNEGEAQIANVDVSHERNSISCTVCSRKFASFTGCLIHYTKCHGRNIKNSPLENDKSENTEHECNSCPHLNDLSCNVCQKSFRSSHGLLIHNGRVHPATESTEGGRQELNDADEQISNSEVNAAESSMGNASQSNAPDTGADNDEVRSSSENQQEWEKSQSSGQVQPQDDSNMTESFHCTVCNKEFPTHRNMLIHKAMAHHEKNDPVLDSSNTDTTLEESTKQQCDLCPRTFKHMRSLLFHKALCHKTILNSWKDESFSIEMRRGSDVSEDDKELKEMQTEEPQSMVETSPECDNNRCNICQREFRSFHGVLVHYAMTHQKNKADDSLAEDKEKNFSDTDLNEINIKHTPKFLNFHQTESSINEDTDAQCNVCTKTLKSPHGLLIHMKKAHPSINYSSTTGKDNPHHCTLCGRAFINQHALSIHYTKFHCKNVATSVMYSEIYKCSLCSASFNSMKGLGIHSTRFHGIKQSEEQTESLEYILYKCKMCLKVFNKKADLQTHLQEVHQSTAWAEQTFTQKAIAPDLSTEEFEYGCVSCSKNFSSLMDLKKHSNDCHKINPDGEILSESEDKYDDEDVERGTTKPLRCPICQKVSYSAVGLKIHCKRAHQTHWSDLQTSQFVTIDFSDESNTSDHNDTAHGAADVNMIDNHKDDNSLPSMDISVSESPRTQINMQSTAQSQP